MKRLKRMEIIRGLENLTGSYPKTVLTIGNFDGIHLGHQKILSMVCKRAEEINGTSMVMTFDPHPIKVIAPERDIKMLTTFDEKARLIGETGINVLLCIKFDREFSHMLPDDFIDNVLVGQINTKEIIVGSNYAFGKNKKGTIDLLRRRGKKYGFSVTAVRNAEVHGHIVSSSTVRSLLLKGAVSEVANFLGRAYSIEGNVIKGRGRGQSLLRIPTANITTPVEIAPKEGVYAVKAGFKGAVYDGVANIGKNPTFGSRHKLRFICSTLTDNLLGENIRIYFIDRIRNERTFPDKVSLERQIHDDIDYAREMLSARHPKL
jgi:riboflavin kinase/FMN adenylyltransferase